MSHAFNVALAAADAGVGRVVLASSNHVMGGYKDDAAHGLVRPSDPPRVGTALNDPAALAKSGDAVAYAAAKLAAERLWRALAAARPGASFVALRVGWCQPGANSPATLCASGCPPQFQTAAGGAIADEAADERWFKGMWLSNGDFARVFRAALFSPTVPPGYSVANAMSANAGARWSLDETEELLGVRPEDDSMA